MGRHMPTQLRLDPANANPMKRSLRQWQSERISIFLQSSVDTPWHHDTTAYKLVFILNIDSFFGTASNSEGPRPAAELQMSRDAIGPDRPCDAWWNMVKIPTELDHGTLKFITASWQPRLFSLGWQQAKSIGPQHTTHTTSWFSTIGSWIWLLICPIP
jgi:hypothetical protein